MKNRGEKGNVKITGLVHRDFNRLRKTLHHMFFFLAILGEIHTIKAFEKERKCRC